MKTKTFLLALFLSLLLPASALARTETAQVGFDVTPRSGTTLYKNAYTPVNWKVETLISVTDQISVYPMIEANLQFPPANEMTFNPSSATTVCPDNKIDAQTSPGPVQQMYNLCPRSVIGQGTAKFALAQSTAPTAILDGYMLIFNGGLVGGKPRIKITAWSYDTNAGVYTEGTLQPDGTISFYVPRLSSDSSVLSLNLEIPGKTKRVRLIKQRKTITLYGGQDLNYVQMKCPTGTFPMSGSFLLGQRTGNNTITESITRDANTSESCLGATGPARFTLTPSGPSAAKVGKKTNYRLLVRNSGASNANRIVVSVAGKGVSFKKTVGNLMPATSTSVAIPLTFKKKGKINVSFRSSAPGVTVKSVAKKVTVK